MEQNKGARLKADKGEKQVFKLFDGLVASPKKQRTRTRRLFLKSREFFRAYFGCYNSQRRG